jgi:methionyl-tRNA synthetase
MEKEVSNMETEARQFSFRQCPWCGAAYRDRQVVKVVCDEAGPHILFVQCDGCGITYQVERVISWQAKTITKTKARAA